MTGLVDKLMSASVLLYLEREMGVDRTWAPPMLLKALADEASYMPRGLQIELMDKVLKDFGPEVLEEAPRILSENSKSPLVFALRNVDVPIQAVEKFIRFKRYLHSLARMEILAQADHSVTVCHYFTGGAPHPGEHRYAYGALKTILEGIGCQNLTCQKEAMADWKSSLSNILKFRVVSESAGLEIWTFRWGAYQSSYMKMEGLDEVLIANLPDLSEIKSVTQQLRSLLWFKLDESITVKLSAEQMGISERKLQRLLQKEGARFTSILTGVRVERAKQLLDRTASSITEIGFFLGFADAAHFSRVFKNNTDMTPSEFRQKSTLNPQAI